MPSGQNEFDETVQETIEEHIEKLNVDERRKRVNRYKRIIVYMLLTIIAISVLLWIVILLKMNQIDQKLNNMTITIADDIWRTIG